EARVYTRLAPEYEPSEVRVSVRVWHRDPACGPLPLRSTDRAQAASEEHAAEKTEEAPALSPTPAEAPPLWHVSEPLVEPRVEDELEPETTPPDHEEERERVPALAASRPDHHRAA